MDGDEIHDLEDESDWSWPVKVESLDEDGEKGDKDKSSMRFLTMSSCLDSKVLFLEISEV